MPSIGRTLAYVLAGIPAAIGVAFVARYAYATSDTPDAGMATAALYAMTAAGAFAGPACALAVANNGRKPAAVVLGFLALLAVAANWTNTLGAIAQRGAGIEANVGKAKEDTAYARAELKRLQGELAKLGGFTPTDAAAVSAAKRAADAATTAKERECGNGDPKQRGKFCREREADEKTAADAYALTTKAKAATDRAAKLEADMAPLAAALKTAPATPSTNALGETLGRWLSLPAASAVSLQQGFLSLIVELLIAAALALPELLRPSVPPTLENAAHATEERAQTALEARTEAPAGKRPLSIGGVTLTPAASPATTGDVARFMLNCLPRAAGEAAPLRSIYARYRRWCAEQEPAVAPLAADAFGIQFRALCDRLRIRSEKRGENVYCIGVKIAA